MEGLYVHCSLSVCLCVCLCVRISCEQNFSRTDVPIWTRFLLNLVAYRTGSNPIEIGDLGSKVKVTVTENVYKNDEKKSKKIQI